MNIVPTDPFQPQKIEFNPGLTTMFPWLSGIAPSFEKYVVRSVRFIYETAQSTFVPGMVMFAPEFNVTDELPSSKAELLEYAYATRAPVWKNFSMSLPSSSVMNYKDYYIRINSISSDLKLYDPFYLIYATDAVSTDLSYCGEIWVEYDIELKLPQRIDRNLILKNAYARYNFGAVTNSAPLAIASRDSGGLLVSINNNHQFIFHETFTGQLQVLINVSNLGLSTDVSLNPPSWSVISDSGATVTLYYTVGGAGATNTDPDYILYAGYAKNIAPGDILNITNLGFYDSGAPSETCTSGTIQFWQAYVG